MKIYWTRKRIPELSALPPSLRKKNFTDAYNAASSHIEYWIGAGVSFISMIILSRVYDFLLPAKILSRVISSEVYVLCVHPY